MNSQQKVNALLTAAGSMGDLQPVIEAALQLQRLGHHATLFAYKEGAIAALQQGVEEVIVLPQTLAGETENNFGYSVPQKLIFAVAGRLVMVNLFAVPTAAVLPTLLERERVVQYEDPKRGKAEHYWNGELLRGSTLPSELRGRQFNLVVGNSMAMPCIYQMCQSFGIRNFACADPFLAANPLATTPLLTYSMFDVERGDIYKQHKGIANLIQWGTVGPMQDKIHKMLGLSGDKISYAEMLRELNALVYAYDPLFQHRNQVWDENTICSGGFFPQSVVEYDFSMLEERLSGVDRLIWVAYGAKAGARGTKKDIRMAVDAAGKVGAFTIIQGPKEYNKFLSPDEARRVLIVSGYVPHHDMFPWLHERGIRVGLHTATGSGTSKMAAKNAVPVVFHGDANYADQKRYSELLQRYGMAMPYTGKTIVSAYQWALSDIARENALKLSRNMTKDGVVTGVNFILSRMD